MYEPLHRLHVVVHPAHQHGLAAERDARIGQPPARLLNLRGQFGRVHEVDAHPQRVVPPQHPAQLRRDPLRQDGRHLGAQPHELHVRDGAHPRQQPVEPVVHHRQWVAAGNQHVPNLRVGRDVVQGPLVLLRIEVVLAGLADHPRPRAIPAVGGAKARDKEQHPVRVAVDQPRHRHMAVFSQRVVRLPGRRDELPGHGHHRLAQRLVRILCVQQRGIVRRDPHRQLSAQPPDGLLLVHRQADDAAEPGQVADAGAELPAPVVPLPQARVREVLPTKLVAARADNVPRRRGLPRRRPLGAATLPRRGGGRHWPVARIGPADPAISQRASRPFDNGSDRGLQKGKGKRLGVRTVGLRIGAQNLVVHASFGPTRRGVTESIRLPYGTVPIL